MAVSKRLRFEVLRRDHFRCRYCGATPAETELRIDHVIPTALGGTDEPSNLVTACEPCNSGKSSVHPDSSLVADADWRAMLWESAMNVLAERRQAERHARALIHHRFISKWREWGFGPPDQRQTVPIPADWPHSIDRWIEAGLTIDDLVALAETAMTSRVKTADTWRYFCGCSWKAVNDIRSQAYEIAELASEMHDEEMARADG